MAGPKDVGNKSTRKKTKRKKVRISEEEILPRKSKPSRKSKVINVDPIDSSNAEETEDETEIEEETLEDVAQYETDKQDDLIENPFVEALLSLEQLWKVPKPRLHEYLVRVTGMQISYGDFKAVLIPGCSGKTGKGKKKADELKLVSKIPFIMRLKDAVDHPVLLHLCRVDSKESITTIGYLCLDLLSFGPTAKHQRLAWTMSPEYCSLHKLTEMPTLQFSLNCSSQLTLSNPILTQGNIFSFFVASMQGLPTQLRGQNSSALYEITVSLPGNIKLLYTGGQLVGSKNTFSEFDENMDDRKKAETNTEEADEFQDKKHWASIIEYWPKIPRYASTLSKDSSIASKEEVSSSNKGVAEIKWNSFRRRLFTAKEYGSFVEEIIKTRFWPVEVVTTFTEAVEDTEGDADSKPTQTFGYYGMALLDMQKIMEPGQQSTRLQCELVPFAEKALKEQTSIGVSAYDALLKKSRNCKMSKDDGTIASDCSNDEWTPGNEGEVPYIVFEIEAWRSTIPDVPETNVIHPNFKQNLAFPVSFMKSADEVAQGFCVYFLQHIANVCSTIESYASPNDPRLLVNNIKTEYLEHLKDLDLYSVFQSRFFQMGWDILRAKTQDFNEEAFENQEDLQSIIFYTYHRYFLDQMHLILNTCLMQELDPLNRFIIFMDQTPNLIFFAEELFENSHFEQSYRLHIEKINRMILKNASPEEEGMAWVDLAIMLMGQEDHRKAKIVALEALKVDPNNVHALIISAVLCTRCSEEECALNYLERIVSLYPLCPELLVIVGHLKQLIGNDQIAKEVLKNANLLDRVKYGDNENTNYSYSRFQFPGTESDSNINKNKNESKGLLSSAHSLNLNKGMTCESVRSSTSDIGDGARLLQLLETSIFPPPFPTPTHFFPWISPKNEGNEWKEIPQNGEGDQEENAPKIKTMPCSTLMSASRLVLQLRIFDVMNAIMLQELQETKNFSCENYLYLRAASEYMQNRPKGALNHVEKALETNPDNGILWALKGHSLRAMKRYEESSECYEQVLQLPAYENENLHLVYLHYGSNCLHQQDAKKAQNIFTEGIENFPSPMLWIGLSDAFYAQEEYCQAELCLSQANKLDNRNPYIWARLARVNLMHNHVEDADKCFKWAIVFGLQPSDPISAELRNMRDEKHLPSLDFPSKCTAPREQYSHRVKISDDGTFGNLEELLVSPLQIFGDRFHNTIREDKLQSAVLINQDLTTSAASDNEQKKSADDNLAAGPSVVNEQDADADVDTTSKRDTKKGKKKTRKSSGGQPAPSKPKGKKKGKGRKSLP